MRELVKLSRNKKAVNARDLHYFLEIKTKFADWIKRQIEDFDFIENKDFVVVLKNEKNSKGGRSSLEYALTLDMAKELSMLARTGKGKEARKYFIQCEKFIQERNAARLESPVMCTALQEHRKELGKETKSFHYSNEQNLVYLVVLGCTAKKWKEVEVQEGQEIRDNLSPLQIEAVNEILNMNTTLIKLGIEYKDRKKQLNAFFEKKYSERMRIEFSQING